MSETPEQRSAHARVAALSRAARTEGATISRKGREAAFERFKVEVDPNGELEPKERTRRALALRRARMAQIARARWQRERDKGAGE